MKSQHLLVMAKAHLLMELVALRNSTNLPELLLMMLVLYSLQTPIIIEFG
jgi:hypothetical protein